MDIISMIAAGAIQLTTLSVGEPAMQIGNAQSYDGVRRNVEHFYDDKNDNLVAGFVITKDSDTVYDVKFDTGHNTPKYDEDPSLVLGIKKRLWLEQTKSGRGSKSVTVAGSNMFGGSVKHTPCLDNFNRQYYCANLTAWSDFEQDNQNEFSLNIKYTQHF